MSGIVVPLRDPRSGRITHVRLTGEGGGGAPPRNEERLLALLDELVLLDLDPVLISSSDPADVLGAFLDWTEFRRARRGVVVVTRTGWSRSPRRGARHGSRRCRRRAEVGRRGASALRPLRARVRSPDRIVVFGDTVRAHVDLAVDLRHVDPGAVKVRVELRPVAARLPATETRTDAGSSSLSASRTCFAA